MEPQDEPVVEIESVTRVAERFGKYRSLGRIGQGGMADVFLAVGRGPAGFNKLVVIKRLRENVAADEAFRDMFLDEARLAARLNHPNVVQTYEVFEDQGAFFIVMEYLEGQPLGRIARECTKRGMRLEPRVCAKIVSDSLAGLGYAHDACDYDGAPLNIVHRDVSPQNIFVTYAGQVKVVDFGIAKAERSNTKTQAGFFKGKAAYMAPEQLEGGTIDRRVDVFTTGIVLWELLSGKKLMAAETTAKTLMRLLRDPVPLLSETVPNIDPGLDRIVDKALQRDPAARYQTAGEMRDAIEQYLVENRQQVRHEEIGRIVADVFREAREDMQRQISEHMAIASEFPPRSGTMPAAILPQGFDPLQTASMSGLSVSGLNVSRTLASGQIQIPSVMAPIPLTPEMLAQVQKPTNRVPSWAVAALAAVSVALAFTVVERRQALTAPASAPPPAAAPVPPAVTAVNQAPPVATPEPAAAEPTHAEPAAPPPSASSPIVTHPAAQVSPWRPSHQAAPARSPASAAAPAPAAVNPPPAPAAQAEPPPAVHSAPPPPAPPPPTAAPQEGRKFRTSL